MAAIIRIANLKKTYNITNTQTQEVLKGIDVEFNSGELVALLGESGCGKSTLINILGGLDNDYTGSVVIKGKFIRDYTECEMDDYRKKRVGLIFQNYNLIPHMTLLENVEISMEMSDVEEKIRKERALDLLKMVGLNDHANKLPSQLSGGQKQRVAIARSLANNPSIILADEPTGALDKESANQILNILKMIAQSGKLVIIVTHSQRVAEDCNRIIKIDDGIITSDTKKERFKNEEFAKFQEPNPKNIQTKNILKISKRNIWNNKNRNILVSFAMSIGIAAFILILCLSQGLTNYVKDYYAADSMSLNITSTINGTISDSKITAIKEVDGVNTVYATHTASNATYTYNDSTNSIFMLNEYYLKFAPTMLYGSTITTNNQVIISESFASTLANGGIISSIGQGLDITYNNINQTFIISGIYEDSTGSSKLKCYISNEYLNNYFTNSTKTINTLLVTVSDITYLDAVASTLTKQGFSNTLYDDSSSVILDYIDLGTTVLTGVAAISMVVSAIMILIVLYISVIERTQEIGILRSIGARRKDIRKIFIFEAGILGLAAGVIGSIFALVIGSVANLICYFSTGILFISYNPLYYLIGILLTITVSVLAGIAPSKKASDLDPIEALRFE